MNKFKAGDKILVKKYNSEGEIVPRWVNYMDNLDGRVFEVMSILENGCIDTVDRYILPPDWCEKIEDTPPDDLSVELNEMLEQREYDLYMSLIHKYIDQIMDGNETLIRNCRGMAKKIINEFKK